MSSWIIDADVQIAIQQYVQANAELNRRSTQRHPLYRHGRYSASFVHAFIQQQQTLKKLLLIRQKLSAELREIDFALSQQEPD